uniref:Uncharacterized protein n=1 Tax=Davidia involucrata TaxID=16924 RepID=A0A5B7B544_DAVIN
MSAPQSSYVMLPENYAGGVPPPPYRRNIPRYESISNQKRQGNCCLRCICYCYCFLFILIFVCAGVLFYFYVVMQPQMPSYQVQALEVKAFNVQMDFSLNTEFLVTVKAENPNKNIGFIYGKDSSVTVSYTDSTLCSGKLPAFRQGHENITMMKVDLKGKSEFGSGLQEALMENKNSKRIPLLVMVKAPINIVLGEIQMRQFVVHVNCSLVVDNLSPNKKIGILSSNYTVGFTA